MPVLPPRLKPLDIELSHLPAALGGLDGYTGVRALLRLHGVPLATVDLPVSAGQISAELLATTIEAASQRPPHPPGCALTRYRPSG